jgi:threonine dehydrogenase-like Zn-dependent dehydrogenase
MKALILTEYNKMTYTDAAKPGIKGPRDLLVRIKAAAICGSDVHGYDGSTGRRIPPLIMGHEASGVVEETGSGVAHFHKGDRITFDSTIYCGTCRFCREGRVNLCDNRRVLGVSCDEYTRDGVFAEYVVIPDHIAYPIPDETTFHQAALTEPAAVAAHAVRISPLSINDTTAVIGSGLIGLLIIQVLRAGSSGMIVAVDTDETRLEMARKMGADITINPARQDPAVVLAEHGKAGGVDLTFEALGSTPTVETAVNMTRKGGSITLVGNIQPQIQLPLQKIVSREIRVTGSCAIAGEYPLVLDMMARNKLDVDSLISAVAPLSEGDAWFKRLYAREQGLLKVILEP